MAGILPKRLLKTDHSDSFFVPCKICKKGSTKTKLHEPDINISRIVFDYGPPQLNLYKYVAEEARFIWENAKEKLFMLKDAGEPIDGFILIHEDGDNAIESCMETFDFDFDQKEKRLLEDDNSLQRQRNIVYLIFLGDDFCEKMNNALGSWLKDLPKYAARSHIFILLDSNDKRDSARDFCKKYKICSVSHIISQDSEKTIFYEAFYKILEKNLGIFLLDLETRKLTRQVHAIKCELNHLIRKLQSRKASAKSAPVLTQSCMDKIKACQKYGIVGYRLCGNDLYVFEDEKLSNKNGQKLQIEKKIGDAFNGPVHFRSLNSFLTPHCAVNCGDFIKNDTFGIMGTIGMFGEIPDKLNRNTTHVVALTSPHVIWAGNVATLPTGERIGECIWPDRSPRNIFDISLIKIDSSVVHSLQRLILDEDVTISEFSREVLEYRKVFKYGASTQFTVGAIEKIDHFRIFDRDVLLIIPKKSQKSFSEEGDSGAIVLTKFRGKYHAIVMILGGNLKLENADCISVKNESIAIPLKYAVNIFQFEKNLSIEFDRI